MTTLCMTLYPGGSIGGGITTSPITRRPSLSLSSRWKSCGICEKVNWPGYCALTIVANSWLVRLPSLFASYCWNIAFV